MTTWNALYQQTQTQAIQSDAHIQLLLQAACEVLDVEMGIISEIQNNDYIVRYSTSPELVGDVFELGYTYCSITFKRDSLVAIQQMSISEWLRHPAYQKFNLETYIGLPLWVNGERYGTVNFSRPQPRPEGFSDTDRAFMQMTGQAISMALELRQRLALND